MYIGEKTMAVSGQQLSKHIPMAMNMHATIEERCFLLAVPRCYNQGS
jgi:hypothetical protein